ncbi:MAG: PIN domain-containing protein [Anaerolineae bacterium]|nr:PIN domain-containing protein [Anaerolineae bacterium]
MTTFLLDTNILSAILRKDATVEQRLRQAIVDDDNLLLSVVVYFEIKRGLLKRDAKKQMATFEYLSNQFAWCDVIVEDWELAAHLWAERFKRGKPIVDADVLIAAQAKRLDAILVTDNIKDFADLGVKTENWKVR